MEQLRSIRVCDCFLDIATYCFPKDLLYSNFFSLMFFFHTSKKRQEKLFYDCELKA